MAMWLYQLTENEDWSSNDYRLEVWEGERWNWPVRRMVGAASQPPLPGDIVIFFYARNGSSDPGFYGWAIVLQWEDKEEIRRLYFRPVAPSDQLKMRPWWDDEGEAARLADAVRGTVKRGNLWRISDDLMGPIRDGISAWVGGRINGRDASSPKLKRTH